MGEDDEAIRRMFTPEFRNRLDSIIPFASLPPEVVAKVVDKFIMQLEVQLEDRNVTIELSDAARVWLSKKGYDPAYGARPLGRVIQENIKKPLADEMLFGKLSKGGTVQVEIDEKVDKPTFIYIAAPPKKKTPKKREADPGEEGDQGGEGDRVPELVE